MARLKFRIVMVRTEYELNLGSASRLMKNFGLSPLYLVRPDCTIGFTARMYAKHSLDILENAKICKTLDEAIDGCSFVVGTSGVLQRHKHALRHPLSLDKFVISLKRMKPKGGIAILFGAEGNGLSEDEIEKCDVMISIPTDKDYPVMNLSHAMAVVLYSIFAKGQDLEWHGGRANAGEEAQLKKTFDALVERYSKNLRNPSKTKLAFRRIIGRAMPDEVEVRAVIGVLKQAQRELEAKKKQ